MTFYHEIEDAEHALEEKRHAYLRKWGWSLTCDFPGSYWVWSRDFSREDEVRLRSWQKRIEGKPEERWSTKPKPYYGLVCVPEAMAISITLSDLDEQPELGGEE